MNVINPFQPYLDQMKQIPGVDPTHLYVKIAKHGTRNTFVKLRGFIDVETRIKTHKGVPFYIKYLAHGRYKFKFDKIMINSEYVRNVEVRERTKELIADYMGLDLTP